MRNDLPPMDCPEPYTRAHELDENLDEAFLEFLRAKGVTVIGCSANGEARTVIVKWIDPAGRANRVDVSDFPAFEGMLREVSHRPDPLDVPVAFDAGPDDLPY